VKRSPEPCGLGRSSTTWASLIRPTKKSWRDQARANPCP
jgi:hypothetical protein